MHILLSFFVLFIFSVPVLAQDHPRRLISLMDYLNGDYENAVRNGKIVSQDEFAEMQEFCERSLELLSQLKVKDKGDKAGIEAELKTLAKRVAEKADAKIIAALTKSVKDKLVKAYRIVAHPKTIPLLADSRILYLENCATCHGESGKGDGPSRESMNPKTPAPADFTDSDRMAGLFPFKAYNTASFGVDGTAMASFAAFSDKQLWQVAFYVLSLRHSAADAAAGAKLFKSRKVPAKLTTVSHLATTPDGELLEQLKPFTADGAEALQLLAYLRRGLLESGSRP